MIDCTGRDWGLFDVPQIN